MIGKHVRCWSRCGCRIIVDVVVGERHAIEEVVNVWEEVLVGEDVLLMGVRDDELVSSHAKRSPKTLSPLSLIHDRKRWGFGGLLSWLVVHTTRQDEEDGEAAQCSRGKRQWWLYVVYPLRGATSLL
jgi:hypothetical protein